MWLLPDKLRHPQYFLCTPSIVCIILNHPSSFQYLLYSPMFYVLSNSLFIVNIVSRPPYCPRSPVWSLHPKILPL